MVSLSIFPKGHEKLLLCRQQNYINYPSNIHVSHWSYEEHNWNLGCSQGKHHFQSGGHPPGTTHPKKEREEFSVLTNTIIQYSDKLQLKRTWKRIYMHINMGYKRNEHNIISQLYFKKLGSPAKDKTNKHKTLKQNKSERAAKLECEQETAMLWEEH